jgi:hypothetical protein
MGVDVRNDRRGSVTSLGTSEGGVGTMAWIHDQGPDPIPAQLLDRIMYLGVPSTGPDGAYFPPAQEGPQAYLAVQGAQVDEIPTHFHSVEQFQCFVSGTGTIGGRPLEGGILHYADRYTPYGPLCAGPRGMTYATLRPYHDTGVFVMPAAQDRLAGLLRASPYRAADRRQHTLDLREPAGEPAPTGRPAWSDLLSAADGFRVAVTGLSGGAVSCSITVGGAGAYVLVVSGALDGDGAPHAAGAVTWRAAGETFRAVATEAGARVALLQFPGGVAP